MRLKRQNLKRFFILKSEINKIINADTKIIIAVNFATTESAIGNGNLNGREFTVSNVVDNKTIQINTTGLGFPDTDFVLTSVLQLIPH